jgi:hypothetical protein
VAEGATNSLPLAPLSPLQPFEAVQVVASVDAHVSVALPPLAMDEGLALNDTVGAGVPPPPPSLPPPPPQEARKAQEADRANRCRERGIGTKRAPGQASIGI